MRGRNQKLTAFFLLVLILAPLSYMFILQVRQQKIRYRMKEELEQSLLQELVIPTSELQWFKPGKEIIVDNHLFDIKSIRYSEDGNAHITGLFDKEETTLVNQMKKEMDRKNHNGLGQIISLFKMIQSLPESNPTNLSILLPIAVHGPIAGAQSLPLVYHLIPTPPPQA